MASYSISQPPDVKKIATVTGINAKTTGATTLFTVPTGNTFVCTAVYVRVTAFTAGGKNQNNNVEVGGNDGVFDNFASESGVGTVALGNVFRIQPAIGEVGTSYAAGIVFSLNISQASNASVETWAVDVFGYLI